MIAASPGGRLRSVSRRPALSKPGAHVRYAAANSPSATIAARTAGREAARAWNARRFGNSPRSTFTTLAQFVTTNR
jgi:hypothetical protein